MIISMHVFNNICNAFNEYIRYNNYYSVTRLCHALLLGNFYVKVAGTYTYYYKRKSLFDITEIKYIYIVHEMYLLERL